MNAIDMLKKDHREVDSLFAAFEAAVPSDHDTRRDIVKRLIHSLRAHAAIEEDVFYPEVESRLDGAIKQDVREASHEHDSITHKLDALAVMDAHDAQYATRVAALKHEVQHHVKEEEEHTLAQVRQTLSNTALKEVGTALVEDREFVDKQASLAEAQESSNADL